MTADGYLMVAAAKTKCILKVERNTSLAEKLSGKKGESTCDHEKKTRIAACSDVACLSDGMYAE
jgi:hypothetical protein